VSEISTIAIAGCGRAGKLHAVAAAKLGLSIVAHSATSDLSSSASQFADLHPKSRWLPLNPDVLCDIADLVVIALPPEVCHRVVGDFISRGRPLLVEKPLALNTDHLSMILKTRTSQGVPVAVGYNRRFYPLIQVVRQQLRQDPIRWAEVTIVEDVDHLLKTKGDVGSSSYLRVGSASHVLDLCRYLFGTGLPQSIERHRSVTHDWFVCYHFTLVADNGSEVRVSVDDVGRDRRGIRIGTQGGKIIELRPLDRLVIRDSGESGSQTVGIAEEINRADSYTSSFIDQLDGLKRGDLTTIHVGEDSLHLSRVIDCLEVASDA